MRFVLNKLQKFLKINLRKIGLALSACCFLANAQSNQLEQEIKLDRQNWMLSVIQSDERGFIQEANLRVEEWYNDPFLRDPGLHRFDTEEHIMGRRRVVDFVINRYMRHLNKELIASLSFLEDEVRDFFRSDDEFQNVYVLHQDQSMFNDISQLSDNKGESVKFKTSFSTQRLRLRMTSSLLNIESQLNRQMEATLSFSRFFSGIGILSEYFWRPMQNNHEVIFSKSLTANLAARSIYASRPLWAPEVESEGRLEFYYGLRF